MGPTFWKGAALLLALLTAALPRIAPAQEIVLGVPTSLTLIEGRESLEAVRLAVEEINSAGGVDIGGRPTLFQIKSMDLRDGLPGEEVSTALTRLDDFITTEKLNAILVGPFRSEVLLAGMDIMARHKTPLLGNIAMSPATEAKVLKDPKYKYAFRVCLNAKYLVDYLIKHMMFLRRRFGFTRVLILNQDVAWAKSTASLTMKLYFNRDGWEVLGQENYPSETTDYSAGLEKARASGAQVILCIFDNPSSGRLVEQWNRMKVPALLTGFISPMVGPRAWQTFHGKIAGALSMVFELGNIPSDRYPPANTFYQAFKERYGQEIEAGHGPAPAYESVYILAEALKQAGSVDPDQVVAALEKTDRAGVMGRIRFHRGHQVIYGDDPAVEALGCLIQWTGDGKRRIVFPESLAEGEIEIPPFMHPVP